MSINEKIFELLREKGLKQSDLAKKLDVTTGLITTWKKRGTTPPAEYLLRICEFLDISIYELLGENEDELTEEEQLLLTHFRKCSSGNQKVLLEATIGLSKHQ